MKSLKKLSAPSDEGAGVLWTPLQSRSTDRGDSRDAVECNETEGEKKQKSFLFLKSFSPSVTAYAVPPPSSEGGIVCAFLP